MVYSNLELDVNDIQYKQPEKIKIKLKPHQLSSLYKAIMMENSGDLTYKIKNFHVYSSLFYDNSNIINNEEEETEITIKTNMGILGDKVGYGKTLIALGLIASNKLENIHINSIYTKSFSSSNHYNYLNISVSNNLIQRNNNIINTTLVIVPRGPVYLQWENTIIEKTNLKMLSINNFTYMKMNLPKYNGSNQKEIIEYFESYDLILIKNTTLKVLIDTYYQGCIFMKSWKRIMIDEAHDIINKIPTYMNYYYLWLITGTYNDLFTKTGYSQYIIGLKEIVNINSISSIIVKNSNDFIKNSFEIPEPIERYYLCRLPTYYQIAKKYLNSSILEKINANDFAGAIRDLGGKNETEDNIIELVSKDLRRGLFNLENEKNYIQNQDIDDDDKNIKINNINVKIEIQNNKIRDLTERIKNYNENSCSICMDIYQDPVLLECTHMFCGSCIFSWLGKNNNNKCPTCRGYINNDKLTAIVKEPKKEIKENIYSKEETLLKIIEENEEGKFLVFTKIDNGFENFKKKLNDMNITFEFLKGNTSHMNNVLERFKKGITKIILLNTQYAGSGIEINYATDVIIFHSMGLDKQQAIGRAQRVGRTSSLRIHNLCYEDEMNK